MSVPPANSRRRTIDAPHPAQAKGAVWLPKRGERRLFSVPGAGGDWRWRWGLPLPLPQGGEGVARQKNRGLSGRALQAGRQLREAGPPQGRAEVWDGQPPAGRGCTAPLC